MKIRKLLKIKSSLDMGFFYSVLFLGLGHLLVWLFMSRVSVVEYGVSALGLLVVMTLFWLIFALLGYFYPIMLFVLATTASLLSFVTAVLILGLSAEPPFKQLIKLLGLGFYFLMLVLCQRVNKANWIVNQ